ncbi:hypothetical protein CDAR_605011 [Caerostris darwini]|uniref:Uncharacterized protein n=1 Tax=Caerostris darwini TaxID=1538125 RepID=A0AAV4X860_9ARAC|nr:hypothetical protein CDAR_605011 [Caerostris darwini]
MISRQDFGLPTGKKDWLSPEREEKILMIYEGKSLLEGHPFSDIDVGIDSRIDILRDSSDWINASPVDIVVTLVSDSHCDFLVHGTASIMEIKFAFQFIDISLLLVGLISLFPFAGINRFSIRLK